MYLFPFWLVINFSASIATSQPHSKTSTAIDYSPSQFPVALLGACISAVTPAMVIFGPSESSPSAISHQLDRGLRLVQLAATNYQQLLISSLALTHVPLAHFSFLHPFFGVITNAFLRSLCCVFFRFDLNRSQATRLFGIGRARLAWTDHFRGVFASLFLHEKKSEGHVLCILQMFRCERFVWLLVTQKIVYLIGSRRFSSDASVPAG